MVELTKYQTLHSAGISPRNIFLQMREDGLDMITAVRTLREQLHLTPEQAKQAVASQDTFTQPQDVFVGATVYWEGADTVNGYWIVEAKVKEIQDDLVYVTCQRKYLLENGLREVDASDVLQSLPRQYFEKGLVQRLEQTLDFFKDFALTH